MIRVLSIIVLLLLVVTGVRWLVRYVDYWRANGKNFRKLAHESGRLNDELLEAADKVILDRSARLRAKAQRAKGDPAYANLRTKPKSRLSTEQVKALRKARNDVRDEYLDKVQLRFYHYLIIFLVASVAGLVLEMIWMFITMGKTELRVGLVWGPFSPLYGFGACLLTMALWNFRKAPAHHVFFISAALGGGLEQMTGMLMEDLFHAQSWTYLGLPDAITQWIAWRFLFAWGIIGIIWCRAIMPEAVYRIGEPTTRVQHILIVLITVFLVADIGMTVACFVRKTARDEGVAARTTFDVYVDSHYDDEFIANRFQNLVVGEDLEPNK